MGIKNKVCIVTGAAGLLGLQFCDALLEAGGLVCLWDIDWAGLHKKVEQLQEKYPDSSLSRIVDITDEESITSSYKAIVKKFGRVDILVNNAANNPKVENNKNQNFSRVEYFTKEQWDRDLSVGLTGAFLCCKVFGTVMAKKKEGVIVNIASDLSVIGPDQRIYRNPELSEENQPVKPISYSVMKTGIIGMTRYLATYWANSGVRVNALSPGGVYNNQPEDFVNRLKQLIPMGRMAEVGEYRKALLFLCSDDSKYMTGQNLVIDGGRSVW